jgi:hypothetical protein
MTLILLLLYFLFLILYFLFSYFYLFRFLTEVSEQALALGAPSGASPTRSADRELTSWAVVVHGSQTRIWRACGPSPRGTVQGVSEERKLFKISD